MKNNLYQKGNALWFILVAIGLLGLLTIMLSKSSSTSNETGGFEQNSIQANAILSYAKGIENAVQGLLTRGCGENDISFWHDSDGNGTEDASDDYFNVRSTLTDRSCHIFDVAGAGMTLIPANERWLDNSQDSEVNFGSFVFSSTNTIVNLETNRDELVVLLNWIDLGTCQALNNILFSEATITEDPDSFSHTPNATGNFDTVSENIDLSSFALHDGESSGCFSSEDEGGFHFYHVLHER